MRDEAIRRRVREGYTEIARTGSLTSVTTPEPSGCCCGGGTPAELASSIGYSIEELEQLPEGANMGLSCGNPTAIANLQPGQTVLDLGSGGGFDVFLAGPKVGPEGRVIGVDMTPDMLSKARSNIAGYARTTGLSNVEFRLGEIEHLPVADASIDVVISNCVINLAPDKAPVWREIARALRPGGRAVVSDIVLLRDLPEAVREIPEASVACVGGAILLDEYERIVREAGFAHLEIERHPQYVEAFMASGDPLYATIASLLPDGETPADYILSVSVTASREKIGADACCSPTSGCC
jgi:SAM-dependent methyltransferase